LDLVQKQLISPEAQLYSVLAIMAMLFAHNCCKTVSGALKDASKAIDTYSARTEGLGDRDTSNGSEDDEGLHCDWSEEEM